MVIDAVAIAKEETGTIRTANMVILGAAAPFIDIEFSKIESAVRSIFERKGEEIVEMNIKALHAGYNKARK